MSREWKPGDVAVIKFSAGDEIGMWLGDRWAVTGGRSQLPNYTISRPLVVIDPEDRQQVERLAHLITEHDKGATEEAWASDLANALREFANPKPPKPEEPTGLGAVVEDESHVEFIHLGSGLWAYGTTDGPSKGFDYADIAAVRSTLR